MKRYEVWVRCGQCKNGETVVLDFGDTDPEAFCEAACADAVESGNCCTWSQ